MKTSSWLYLLLLGGICVCAQAGEGPKPAASEEQKQVPDALKPIEVKGGVVSNDGAEGGKQLYLIPDELAGLNKVTGKQDLLNTKISKEYKDIRDLYVDFAKATEEVAKWKDARKKAVEKENERFESKSKRLKDDDLNDEKKRHNEKLGQIADFHDRKDKTADEVLKAARAKLDKEMTALWAACKSGENNAVACTSDAGAKYAVQLPHAGKYYVCAVDTDFFSPIEFKAGDNELHLLRPGEKSQKPGKGKDDKNPDKSSDDKNKDKK